MNKALQTMLDNMPEKTGKSLDEWKELLGKKQFTKHSEAVRYLKSEYGVTHGFANTIVTLSKADNQSPDDLLENQYKGKENLFPIYERLVQKISALGNDITITPKKTSVSLIRKKQFALIKPATKTRIDLGLKLKDKPTTDRLEDSGPFGTMCTHRVRISQEGQLDNELLNWLKEAYEKASE
jgi:predicted transport protein